MATSKYIRQALRDVFEPHLKAEGFVGKHPHFRRQEGKTLHLLSVIYDKFGGGFTFEFANHPPGTLRTSWGTIVPEEQLEIGHADVSNRARLVMTTQGQGTYDDFFRYDAFSGDKRACTELVVNAVKMFPQINDWLRTKSAGPNIASF